MLASRASRILRSSLACVALSACGASNSNDDGPAADAQSISGVDAASNFDGALPSTDAATNDAMQPDSGTDASPQIDAGPGSGSFVYYFGDFDTQELFQVARVDLRNRSRSLLPIAGLDQGGDITGLALRRDNGTLAVAGKNTLNSAPQLRVYPPDGSGSGTLLFSAMDADRLISVLQYSPDGNWIGFLTDSEIVGSKALHVVPADGSSEAIRVSLPPVAASQDVQSFRWASDSAHIAFVGDLAVSNQDALWTVNASASLPTPVAVIGAAELGGRDVGRSIAFDSSDRLYFLADFELADNQSRLYRAALNGDDYEQVPGTALNNAVGEATVSGFAISPNGTRIALASDSPTATLFQVYTLDLNSTSAILVSNLSTATPPDSERGPNAFEAMRWSPDGAALTMAADWPIGMDANNDFGAFVVPTGNTPGGVGLAKSTVSSGDVFTPAFGADASQILFRGDLLASNRSDLYLVEDLELAAQAPSGLVLQESTTGGTVKGFIVSWP